MSTIQTNNEITSTNIIWEFYLKYYKKYTKNVNEIIMKKTTFKYIENYRYNQT